MTASTPMHNTCLPSMRHAQEYTMYMYREHVCVCIYRPCTEHVGACIKHVQKMCIHVQKSVYMHRTCAYMYHTCIDLVHHTKA